MIEGSWSEAEEPVGKSGALARGKELAAKARERKRPVTTGGALAFLALIVLLVRSRKRSRERQAVIEGVQGLLAEIVGSRRRRLRPLSFSPRGRRTWRKEPRRRRRSATVIARTRLPLKVGRRDEEVVEEVEVVEIGEEPATQPAAVSREGRLRPMFLRLEKR